MDTTNISKSFLYGGISGMFGVILSHPIDTIKTSIQEKITLSYKINDLHKLYRGISAPLIGVGLEKAVVFGIYETISKKYMNKADPWKKNIVSGACAGLGASLIVTPVDRIKILLQTNNQIKRTLSLRYLYSGLSATFTRKTPGFAIYFTVYESLKNYFYESKPIPKYGSFIFGGFAGAIAWIFIYPQDRIKTKIQASQENLKFINIIKMLYKTEGIKGYYKGFQYALMRAVPLHAGTFMMMETLKKEKS
jgi:hypothetical protein